MSEQQYQNFEVMHNTSTEPTAVEAMTRAEVDIQIATAHRFPRNLKQVASEIMRDATVDVETAESMFYSLPRGGKRIEGGSIRLAEIVANAYGNIRAGARVLQVVTAGDAPSVVVQAVCHDLQRNSLITIEKRGRIIAKIDRETGERKKPDEDDINLAANNATSKALRDAIFRVVPASLVKPVLGAAKEVARGKATSLGDRRGKAIATFAKMGVTQAQVLARLERNSVEEMTADDLDTLTGLRTAIKEGEVSAEDEFPSSAGESAKAAAPARRSATRGREASDPGATPPSPAAGQEGEPA